MNAFVACANVSQDEPTQLRNTAENTVSVMTIHAVTIKTSCVGVSIVLNFEHFCILPFFLCLKQLEFVTKSLLLILFENL